jgi:hypothetical protein
MEVGPFRLRKTVSHSVQLKKPSGKTSSVHLLSLNLVAWFGPYIHNGSKLIVKQIVARFEFVRSIGSADNGKLTAVKDGARSVACLITINRHPAILTKELIRRTILKDTSTELKVHELRGKVHQPTKPWSLELRVQSVLSGLSDLCHFPKATLC